MESNNMSYKDALLIQIIQLLEWLNEDDLQGLLEALEHDFYTLDNGYLN